MSRARLAAIVPLALTLLGMTVGPATAALAANPDPIIQFAGTANISTVEGDVYAWPITIRIDCTTLPCYGTGSISGEGQTAEVLAGGLALPGASGSLDVPSSGDVCAETYSGAGPLTYSATADSITLVRDFAGSPETDCGDGTTVQYIGVHLETTAAYVSGEICLFLGTCATATPTPTPIATAIALPLGPGPVVPPGEFSSPGTLSTLPTVIDALRPANVIWATALTVVLVILIALPSQLFNTAIEKGSDRVSGWWRARRTTAPATKQSWTGWPWAAGGLLAASLISSFVDPSFGFTPSSIRVFLSILVSFLLDAVSGWFLVIWLVRRSTPGATATFRFVPATLVIVLAAVLFSRFTGFQPGIVFGLVAGVVFGAILAASQKARVALIGLGYSFALAVVGWIGYSAILGAGLLSPLAVFAQETFSAMAIGGIASLPIALIPLRGLTGFEVFAWNRWVWAASYAVGLFGFFFVLMPMPFAWRGVPLEVGLWVGLYLLYAAVGVGFWALVVRPWEKTPTESVSTESVSTEGADA